MAKNTKPQQCFCEVRHAGPCPSPRIEHRKPEEIGAEYGRVCAELGQAMYMRDVGLPKQIEELIEKAKSLNLEAHAAKQATPTTETKTNGNP